MTHGAFLPARSDARRFLDIILDVEPESRWNLKKVFSRKATPPKPSLDGASEKHVTLIKQAETPSPVRHQPNDLERGRGEVAFLAQIITCLSITDLKITSVLDSLVTDKGIDYAVAVSDQGSAVS